MDERGVTFSTKNGATDTLAPVEFIRRFLLHVLPSGFVKIRHFGLLAPGNVNTRLEAARALLAPVPALRPAFAGIPAPTTLVAVTGSMEQPRPPATWRDILFKLTGVDLTRCRVCSQRTIIRYVLSSGWPRLRHAPVPAGHDTS